MKQAVSQAVWVIVAATMIQFTVPAAPYAAAPPALAAKRYEQLDKLALSYFKTLTPAEEIVLHGVTAGTTAWCSGHQPHGSMLPEDDPENAVKYRWDREREVEAAFVVWLVTDADAGKLIDPSGIEIAEAWIDGDLRLSDVKIDLPLTLYRCYLPGAIKLVAAEGSLLDLDESTVKGAIDARSLVLNRDLLIRDGKYEQINLSHARLKGNLDFSGSNVSAPAGRDAVALVEASVKGDVLFQNSDAPARTFSTNGLVDLKMADVGGEVSFKGSVFNTRQSNGFKAPYARIAGPLYWQGVTLRQNTEVDLTAAHVGSLRDDVRDWPWNRQLYLDGFEYGRFGPDANGSTDQRVAWLNLQPEDFRPQPFTYLAKVLRASGREDEATKVDEARGDAEVKYAQMGFPRRAWEWVLGRAIGYGYEPLNVVWVILFFVGLGWALFYLGYQKHKIIPTDKDAFADFSADPGAIPPWYQQFNSLVYSLETFIPLVDLSQGKNWAPGPITTRWNYMRPWKNDGAQMLRIYLWVHILLGWFFTAMLAAGVTGLVHPG